MVLESLRLLNFRNYEKLELDSLGVNNLIIGENGSGKTNLLEAIHLLSGVSPFQGSSLTDLIRYGQSSFYISGFLDGHHHEMGVSTEKRILKMNDNPVAVKEFGATTPIIAFIPEDSLMVCGKPEEKRAVMDKIIASSRRDYLYTLRRYQRALRQRNSQLKIKPDEAKIWNNELITYGSVIIEQRITTVRALNESIRELYCQFYGENIEIAYRNPFRIEKSIEDSFKMALERSAIEERERGFTLMGPHRDSYEFMKTDKTYKNSASRGQKRMAALLLKLAVVKICAQIFETTPIILLDDVLLEIDSKRRTLFLDQILGQYQAFITATTTSLFENFPNNTKIFHIQQGMLK